MPGPSPTHPPPDRTTTTAGRHPEQTEAWQRLRAGILRHAVQLDQRLSFDIRLLLTQTDMAHLAGRLLWARIRALEPQVLVAPGFGAMPLAYATAHAAWADGVALNVLMVRDQRKTYHQKRWVEGHRPAPGTRAVVVDDFMAGGSLLDLVDQALAADGIELQLQAAAVFFDMWEPLGSRQMQLKRLPVIRLFTRHDIGLSRDCHDACPPAMKGSAPDFIGPPLWWRMGLNSPGRYPQSHTQPLDTTAQLDDTARLIDAAQLRRQVGVVLQENLLFNRSVRENIAIADPAAPLEAVVHAARMAGAHDFVSELPEGYDTMVGEQGSSLSGGQRQRIAIARALFTNPRILILDEATSALDYESEAIIQRNMAGICKGRTVLIIAHRLSAVREAHRIIVMDRGRIAEAGTHAQLLQRPQGLYARLWRLQGHGPEPAPGARAEQTAAAMGETA